MVFRLAGKYSPQGGRAHLAGEGEVVQAGDSEPGPVDAVVA
jgi:hypothetical protein